MAAASGESSSGNNSTPFRAFPAVHEDENRLMHESKHSYDFSQFVRKKRKWVPKKVSAPCRNQLDGVQLDPLQPRPIEDFLLVITVIELIKGVILL